MPLTAVQSWPLSVMSGHSMPHYERPVTVTDDIRNDKFSGAPLLHVHCNAFSAGVGSIGAAKRTTSCDEPYLLESEA